MVGTSGSNELRGGAGVDELRGGAGDDRLYGEAGDDTLIGNEGDDLLIGGAGGDALDGGSGFDTVSYADSNGRVVINLGMNYAASGHAAGDSLTSIEGVIGSAFNDRIAGSSGADALHGGDGDDYLRGEAGGDLLDGGDGSDTACYNGSDARVVVNLGLDYAASGHAAGDSFVSIENVIGSAGNDRIAGSAEENVLSGGAGNDYLRGEAGNDELFGGSGNDLFAFSAGDGDDEIGDFVVDTDHLVLNGITIDTTEELDGNGDSILDTLVTFSSGDTVLLAGVTGVTEPGDLIA